VSEVAGGAPAARESGLPSREEAILAVARAAQRAGAAVFAGNGYNARTLAALAGRPEHFCMVGSMGLGPLIAAGFSHCSGRATIVVEGDGNALMGLSGWPAAVKAAAAPFVHVVLDNGVYETTGGQKTLAPGVDFLALAGGCGYQRAVRVETVAALDETLATALRGPAKTFLHVPSRRQTGAAHPRVPYTPEEIAARFLAAFDRGGRPEPREVPW